MINEFKWNLEYVLSHKMSEQTLKAAGIKKISPEEIFVQHPVYKDYYVSQWGRAISKKHKKVKLLGANIGGQPDRQYLYYGFSDGVTHTISANRAVADVFCPNFWSDDVRLEAHHLDGNRMNNDHQNLILLPVKLHNAIHKIKKIVMLNSDELIEYKNPLDLVYDTGLTLEQILLANEGKNKPVSYQRDYAVYSIDGYLIGFQSY